MLNRIAVSSITKAFPTTFIRPFSSKKGKEYVYSEYKQYSIREPEKVKPKVIITEHHIPMVEPNMTNITSSMSSKSVRVCSFLSAIIVSDNSWIHPNEDTDELKSGSKFKECKIPVYTDIDIVDRSIKNTVGPFQIDPYIKVLHISRRHICLKDVINGYFYDNIKIDTAYGILTSNKIRIKIGYGDKTDDENKEYCQDICDDIRDSIKPTEVKEPAVEEKSLEPIEITNPVEVTDPVEPIKVTNPAEITNSTNPTLLDAHKLLFANADIIDADPELVKCMEAVYILKRAHCSASKGDLLNAIQTVIADSP